MFQPGFSTPFTRVTTFMSVEFATQVVQQLVQAGYTAYWAGGCVRDLLRGAEPKDYDVATNATPEQVRSLFGPRRSLPVGESFGVVIVLGKKGAGESVEVATFRREGEYVDGRRPASVEFCSAQEDASRRDFTINGMFFDPLTRVVHDFVGGEADLNRRLIRAIGDPRARMSEDKLRMLRAVRFAASLDFAIDEETAQAVRSMAGEVCVVSAERIAQELRRMLASTTRAKAMQLFHDLRLMAVVLPEVPDSLSKQHEAAWSELLTLLQQLGEATFEVGMAALLRSVPSASASSRRGAATEGTVLGVCGRLRLSNEETGSICWLVEHQNRFDSFPSMTLAQQKRFSVEPGFDDLLWLERTAAQVASKHLEPYQFVDRFLAANPLEVRNPPQFITGADLLAQGMKSGPAFKEILNAVRDAQLNREIQTREEALELSRKLALPRS